MGIEELKQRVLHPDATGFSIRRAPKKEVELFKDIANEEYLGDYGMLFKAMVNGFLEFKEFKKKYFESEDYEVIFVNKKRICQN